ncbi:MAG: DUF4258 domain-containing protein [Defluviitaleaceae bacterium]|nr:DUF4258 domain-containing protein [Defluviitaleaceae bacterium]MCL2239062.1 DUF4258 domain-containing protein [Defluviitaleaceae bacterium]
MSGDVRGLKSASGILIGGITYHASLRMEERGISHETLVDLIKNAAIIYPDRNPARICQQKDRWKLVLDRNTGDIVTIVDLSS